MVADITTDKGRASALKACPEPDIVVNNSGGPPAGNFRDWDREAWIAALNNNMLSAILMIKDVVDGMIARKFERGEGSDQYSRPFKQRPVRFHHRSELADRRRQVPGDLLMLSAERAIRVAGGAEEVHLVTEEAVQNWGVAGGARDGLQPTV